MTKPTSKGRRLLAALTCILFLSTLVHAYQEGETSTNRLENLNLRIVELRSQGKFSEAVSVAREAVDLADKIDGIPDNEKASALNALGSLYLLTDDYVHAEPVLQRCVLVTEKAFGSDNKFVAVALNNLATLYLYKSDYNNAEPLLKRSLKIKETTLGIDCLETINALNNLAELYHETGDYQQALTLLERGIEAIHKIKAEKNPLSARVLNNLAGLYQDMGESAKAEGLFHQSLKTAEATFGLDHPDTGAILQGLASLYVQAGDYSRALPLLQRNLQIAEQAVGTNSLATASALNSIAALYLHLKSSAQAEPLLLRALKIREGVLGPAHPAIGVSLNNLGVFYLKTGDFSKAKHLLDRALHQTERVMGTNHPDLVSTLNSLATTLSCMGQYGEAEASFLRGLSIGESVFGPYHPLTAAALSSLALLKLQGGETNAALAFGRRNQRATEKMLGDFTMYSSERQRMAYQRVQSPYDILGSIGSAPELAEAILRTKGAILDSLQEDKLCCSLSDPKIQLTVAQLRKEERRLASLELEVPPKAGDDMMKSVRSKREDSEGVVEKLQKVLAENVQSIRHHRRSLETTASNLQAVLPMDSAVIEYIRYNHYIGNDHFEQRYGAIVIFPQQPNPIAGVRSQIVWCGLDDAKSIELNLKSYARIMRNGKKGEHAILRTVYAQLFAPIHRQLPQSVRTLIISPDAELNFVSFGTLVTANHEFLAEKFTLEYTTSSRELVLRGTSTNSGRKLIAFGNPAFAETPDFCRSTTHGELQGTRAGACRSYSGLILQPLPGTEKELLFFKANSKKWRIDDEYYIGRSASEAALNNLHSPYILHLATHGFYLPDESPEVFRNTNAFRVIAECPPVALRSPMQRSGLALAGARTTLDAWRRGETPETSNDGILMAQEVGQMDLKATWLVALSACDTGVGEAQAGEGVLGLRRGFMQAGAQNLLITLWPVSDKWTVEIMKSFYNQALKTGNAPLAMAEVQREWLVRLKQEYGALTAAKIAGPFILTFQGAQ